jgi:2-dehydro-3-deoxygalactonokinase
VKPPLIAVDWGTTSLRAALLDARGQVLEEHSSGDGILHVPAGGYAPVFIAACARWMQAAGTFCLMSGMVGSRQGWIEAPYRACPAGFADLAAALAPVDAGLSNARVAIVPGLSCEREGVPDVMRGEETQVFGALDLLGLESGLFVLPGTHSKWVTVKDRRIESFSTFMTGEFYALLRQHSLLARSLPAQDGPLDEAAFRRGLAQAHRAGSLLRSAFSTRTLSLFDRLPAASLPSYLSGLVIGEEIRVQAGLAAHAPVVLVGAPELTLRYQLALAEAGVQARRVGAEATWRGLWAIAQTLEAGP